MSDAARAKAGEMAMQFGFPGVQRYIDMFTKDLDAFAAEQTAQMRLQLEGTREALHDAETLVERLREILRRAGDAIPKCGIGCNLDDEYYRPCLGCSIHALLADLAVQERQP